MFISSSCLHFDFIGISDEIEQRETFVLDNSFFRLVKYRFILLQFDACLVPGGKKFHIKLQTNWLASFCAICIKLSKEKTNISPNTTTWQGVGGEWL